MTICFDDILAEIERLTTAAPEGFTVQEMSDQTQRSLAWCRNKLGVLHREGKVELAGRRRTVRIDGIAGYVPVYRPTQRPSGPAAG